jgi:hypothetical protein
MLLLFTTPSPFTEFPVSFFYLPEQVREAGQEHAEFNPSVSSLFVHDPFHHLLPVHNDRMAIRFGEEDVFPIIDEKSISKQGVKGEFQTSFFK